MKNFGFIAILLVLLMAFPVFAGGSSERAETQSPEGVRSVLVYITGVVAGSPTYQTLADGAALFAADHPDFKVRVYEAGFNQGEWESQLLSLVATGEYDLVLASNPSLPEICASVGERFPEQKFVITDAEFVGNGSIRTYFFNQYEQCLYLGYLAGLVAESGMSGTNSSHRIGYIAAQEYPMLNRHMTVGFLDGARMVNPEITLDLRIIGNWYDANKAAELTSSMMDAGAAVFTSTCGGAAEGMYKILSDRGGYALVQNTDDYAAAPGVIIGCGLLSQEDLVAEILQEAYDGTLEYGISTTLGAEDGTLGFIFDNPSYQGLPEDIRARFEAFFDDILEGRVDYTVPSLYN